MLTVGIAELFPRVSESFHFLLRHGEKLCLARHRHASPQALQRIYPHTSGLMRFCGLFRPSSASHSTAVRNRSREIPKSLAASSRQCAQVQRLMNIKPEVFSVPPWAIYPNTRDCLPLHTGPSKP